MAPLQGDQFRRYSRHLILPEIGMGGQQKLLEAKVLCIGAGGVTRQLNRLLDLLAYGGGAVHGVMRRVGGVVRAVRVGVNRQGFEAAVMGDGVRFHFGDRPRRYSEPGTNGRRRSCSASLRRESTSCA